MEVIIDQGTVFVPNPYKRRIFSVKVKVYLALAAAFVIAGILSGAML